MANLKSNRRIRDLSRRPRVWSITSTTGMSEGSRITTYPLRRKDKHGEQAVMTNTLKVEKIAGANLSAELPGA
jgi:hypothetical protein